MKSNKNICVAVAATTGKEALAIAQKSQDQADVIEIRLDTLEKADVQIFTDGLSKPLLFTNRADWEGGNYKGSEEGRLGLLSEAVDAGAAYIDVELKTEPALQQNLFAKAKGITQTIVSWHNFSTTPSSQALLTILQEQYRSGADIGKIVTMAHCYDDVLRVLDLQRQAAEIGFPLIAFCMGRAGVISRVATLELGGLMTYAAPDSQEGTAPGQLPISALRRILGEFRHAD